MMVPPPPVLYEVRQVDLGVYYGASGAVRAPVAPPDGMTSYGFVAWPLDSWTHNNRGGTNHDEGGANRSRTVDHHVVHRDLLSLEVNRFRLENANLQGLEIPMPASWNRKNAERIALIEREYRQGGLSPDDDAKLARLQAEVFDELDETIPLPFDALDRLEAEIRQIQAEIAAEGDHE